jgi:hypothetical protein
VLFSTLGQTKRLPVAKDPDIWIFSKFGFVCQTMNKSGPVFVKKNVRSADHSLWIRGSILDHGRKRSQEAFHENVRQEPCFPYTGVSCYDNRPVHLSPNISDCGNPVSLRPVFILLQKEISLLFAICISLSYPFVRSFGAVYTGGPRRPLK